MASYEVMRRYLDLIKAGEMVAAQDFYSDDIVVHVAGWKTVNGKDEWNVALGEMMGMVDGLKVEEHDLLVSDDHAVVLDAWVINKGDREESVNHVIVYHTDGDKISEMWVVAEDQALMNELMS